MSSRPPPSDAANDLARAAARGDPGLIRELWQFLRQRKKWWLGPIVLALVFVGLLIALGSSALAPVIYTLF